MKGFGDVKFHLDFGESILLHYMMYVLGLKRNLASISSLKDKGMRVAFIRGKVLTWPKESHMWDAFPWDIELKDPIESMEDLYWKWSMKSIIKVSYGTEGWYIYIMKRC